MNLASFTNIQLAVTGVWIVVSVCVFWSLIYRKHTISKRFVQQITYLQLFNWILIFIYMTFYLNELRLLALFCGHLGLVFLLTGSGFLGVLYTLDMRCRLLWCNHLLLHLWVTPARRLWYGAFLPPLLFPYSGIFV